jgi:hypothetical protein
MLRSAPVLLFVVLGATGCSWLGSSSSGSSTVVAPAGLTDGRYFGYVRAVHPQAKPVTIDFDRATFLVGKAANRAARADGVLPPGQSIPDDYYVRNADKRTVLLALAPAIRVSAVRCLTSCKEGYTGERVGWLASFNRHGATLEDRYRGAETQYWLTVRGGRVTRVDEQYLP